MSDVTSITERLGRSGGVKYEYFPSPIKGIRNYLTASHHVAPLLFECRLVQELPPFYFSLSYYHAKYHPLNRSNLSKFMMEINHIQTTAMELEAMGAKENNDDRDMARLGKSPVLKVRRPLLPQVILLRMILID